MRADRTLSAVSQCLPTQLTFRIVRFKLLSSKGHSDCQQSLINLESVRMLIYFTYGLLLTYVSLPGHSLGDLAFRCPSCTAERLAACPKVTAMCPEIVRELGCGCCPVCARQVGELCGVYTPRCSNGLRCYPSMDAELPLQQLIQGLGRCGQKVDVNDTPGLDHQATNGKLVLQSFLLSSGSNDHAQMPWLFKHFFFASFSSLFWFQSRQVHSLAQPHCSYQGSCFWQQYANVLEHEVSTQLQHSDIQQLTSQVLYNFRIER